MKSHGILLRNLLRALIDEWGEKEVADALARISDSRIAFGTPDAEWVASPPKRRDRLNAIEQVERAQLDESRKQILLSLAERYELKHFLPSVADVREFLIMMGERPMGMKDRKEAFKVLLRSLAKLPLENLQQIARTSMHSGPSELGPLSDAIAAVGESLQRNRLGGYHRKLDT